MILNIQKLLRKLIEISTLFFYNSSYIFSRAQFKFFEDSNSRRRISLGEYTVYLKEFHLYLFRFKQKWEQTLEISIFACLNLETCLNPSLKFKPITIVLTTLVTEFWWAITNLAFSKNLKNFLFFHIIIFWLSFQRSQRYPHSWGRASIIPGRRSLRALKSFFLEKSTKFN